jgi:uncharacterized repeat protein (TIGR03803 family)
MAGVVPLLCIAMAIASQAQGFQTLFEFNGADGSSVQSLVQGTDGNFYGVTAEGGQNSQCIYDGCGTVFKITPDGRFKTIHTFCLDQGCPDGSSPFGGLVLGRDQNFYGMTYAGGGGSGSVFKISPLGALTTIYSFHETDGANPQAAMILAPDGNFYGTTTVGGTYGLGTVFRITPGGQLTTLHSFCAQPGCTDGAFPMALMQASDGNFYGTTAGGGTGNPDYCKDVQYACGTVFRISSKGAFATIFNFCSSERCAEGAVPMGKLVQASNGLLYGTTLESGDFLCGPPYGCGTVFQLRLNGKEGTVHIFRGPEGAKPYAGVIQTTDGYLWGTAANSIFEINPDGTLVDQHDLDGGAAEEVIQATNGILYGTTASGGANGAGTVFSFANNWGPFVAFVVPGGKVGQTGGILGQGFTGTTSVKVNGVSASYTVVSDTYITTTVPPAATTGYVTVTTPSGTLTSNVPFHVIP